MDTSDNLSAAAVPAVAAISNAGGDAAITASNPPGQPRTCTQRYSNDVQLCTSAWPHSLTLLFAVHCCV